MISVAYVDGYHDRILTTDTTLLFESAIRDIISEADEAYDNYLNTYNQIMFESAIEGLSDEMNETLYTESSNVFEKIGESIIKMVKTLKEYIAKMIGKLSGFEKKTDLEKISAAVKKNPEIGDDLVAAFNSGKLTVADAKSIKDIEDNYMQLIKLAKDKNVSADTLQGKFNAFKKKCEDADKSAIVTVAKATGATITGVMSIFLIKKTLNEIKKSDSDALSSLNKTSDAMVEALQEMQKSNDANIQKGINPNLGKVTLMKNIQSYMCGRYEDIITKNEASHNKITSALRSVLNKIDKKAVLTSKIDAKEKENKKKDVAAAKAFIKNSNEKYDIRNPKVDREEERRKNRQDAADRAYGTEKGKRDYEGKHYQKVLGDVQSKAEIQQRGRDNAVDLDLEREKAKVQAQGRAEGTPDKKPGVQKIEIVNNKNKNTKNNNNQKNTK